MVEDWVVCWGDQVDVEWFDQCYCVEYVFVERLYDVGVVVFE